MEKNKDFADKCYQMYDDDIYLKETFIVKVLK